MKHLKLVSILLVSIIIFSGCASLNPAGKQANQIGEKADGVMVEKTPGVSNEVMAKKTPVASESGVTTDKKPATSDGVMADKKFSDIGLTKYANKYYRYDPVAYQNALADKKIVYIYFYANWCPICKAARPKILDAFNKIDYSDVVGFEVHYNDDEAKDFDKEITRNYQVPYQHTTLIIKDGKEFYRSLNELTTEEIIKQIESARNS